MTFNSTNGRTTPESRTSTDCNCSPNNHINHISIPQVQHIWLITGPAGCGKTTVARCVSKKLHMHYLEGDDFHSKANIEKMANGIPLTDGDRWDWLLTIRQASINTLNNASPHSPNDKLDGVVVTCSALKKSYRDVLRGKPTPSHSSHPSQPNSIIGGVAEPKWREEEGIDAKEHEIRTHFLYLSADEEVLIKRVAGREGHYMGANMVKSQLVDLEAPSKEEKDSLGLDVGKPADEVEAEAVRIIGERMRSG